ncbi:AmiS/UreI family transporter [Saccharopolyspora sp. NPDC003752]
MAYVGLLYVGAVLFLNGVMLLGKADPKAIGVFNLFVGALQVITPTILIAVNLGDPVTVLSASGIYLFGFTYLYVGIGLLGDFDTSGVGWFSLFVAIMALGYSFANFRLLGDSPFGVIWLYWSFLWLLFFLLLGLKMERLTRYTGWVAAIEGWVTAAIPSFLIMTGYWRNPNAIATALVIFGVVVFVALWLFTTGVWSVRGVRTLSAPHRPAHQ